MGASVYELPPGQALCPYHYESDEEWMIVLEGAVSVRHPDGTDVLGPGDTAAFPIGPAGAHKVFNASEETVRFIMLSTKGDPAYAVYPDSNKIQFCNGPPEERALVRLGENLDYYDGETALEEGLALAAVGRHGVDDLLAADRGARRRSARTARPPWRGGTTRGRRPAARPRPCPRAASAPRPRPRAASSLRPAGRTGRGSRSRPAAPEAG